jgi:isopenicillin N synthase-like dioxygenase
MYETTAQFFALPDDQKQRWVSPTGNPYRGWAMQAPDGEAGMRLREQFEVCRYDAAADLSEAGYGSRWTEGFEPNIWPDEPESFRSVWGAYAAAMRQLGRRLLSICAVGLGLDADWFADKFDREASYLAANLYPAPTRQEQARTPDGLRFGAHTDIGSLTILYQDGNEGRLQVLDRLQRWCDVPNVPDAFVVNLGDMLAKWTNDRWVATRHRVVRASGAVSGSPRISIPFFQHPNLDALIQCVPTCTNAGNPPKYPAVLGGEWANYRFTTEDYSRLRYE